MCKAWIRFEHSVSINCDKGLDHTGHHRNEENLVTWSQ
jgi:hypothetical protein